MSNGIGYTWCVVCADILEKQRGIFPLFREWMRREMNSSEAFQFVTIEQSESHLEDLGTKCVQVCIPHVCVFLPLYSLSPPLPFFFLLKFGSNNPKSISYKEMTATSCLCPSLSSWWAGAHGCAVGSELCSWLLMQENTQVSKGGISRFS